MFSEHELAFYTNENGGIMSGGFSVNSILMNKGTGLMSTKNIQLGGSDLFHDLAVPSLLLHLNRHNGGNSLSSKKHIDEEKEVIDASIHDRLLELIQVNPCNTKKTTKNRKEKNKKSITKKRKLHKNEKL